MQHDGWVEGSGTPNTPGAIGVTYASLQSIFINPSADEGLGTFGYDGSSAGTFTYALTLSPGQAADVLTGDPVSLRFSAADGAVSYLFNSRRFGTTANRPLLTINVVPEPATLALLIASGVLGATLKWKPGRK